MSDPAPSKIDPRTLKVEQARLARFFQSINKHRKALDLAIEQDFGGTLDPVQWRSAFESDEPPSDATERALPLLSAVRFEYGTAASRRLRW